MTPSARSWALPESAPSPHSCLIPPHIFNKRTIEFLLWWRRLNTSLDPPEFVFIGQNNHGKTALLEAILGHSYTKDILNNLPPSPPSSTLSLAALSLLSHIPLFLVSFLDPCARKPTKRPVQINLLNNPACADPKVTVKRDDFLWSKSPEFCRDVEVLASTTTTTTTHS